MNRTIKALGLGLLAALAMSAFAVVGASANNNHTGGHFTLATGTSATLHGTGGPGHPHQAKLHAFGSTVECTETYTGSVNAATVTSVTVTPHYGPCANGRTVHMNGCNYTFTARNTSVSTLHNAVHLVCPVGKKAEVTTHDNSCTITFGPQTITNAVTYTRVTVNGKHAITAHITANEIIYEKHGLCTFVGPTTGTGPHGGGGNGHGAQLTGTALLTASSGGNPVGITATGTNGH